MFSLPTLNTVHYNSLLKNKKKVWRKKIDSNESFKIEYFDKVSRPGIAAEMNTKLTSENSEFEQYFNIKSILKFE